MKESWKDDLERPSYPLAVFLPKLGWQQFFHDRYVDQQAELDWIEVSSEAGVFFLEGYTETDRGLLTITIHIHP